MAKKQYKRRKKVQSKKDGKSHLRSDWSDLSGKLEMTSSDNARYWGLFGTVAILFLLILATAPKNSGF